MSATAGRSHVGDEVGADEAKVVALSKRSKSRSRLIIMNEYTSLFFFVAFLMFFNRGTQKLHEPTSSKQSLTFLRFSIHVEIATHLHSAQSTRLQGDIIRPFSNQEIPHTLLVFLHV